MSDRVLVKSRVAGVAWNGRDIPIVRVRWRHGDRPVEVYVRTPRTRFWLAWHAGHSVEWTWVRFKRRAKAEGGPDFKGFRWVREELWAYEGGWESEWLEAS